MLFINNGGPVKIRIGKASDCNWTTIRKGQKVELSPGYGRALGFSKIKTTEGRIGDKKVETKQIDVVNDVVNDTDNFFKELCSIKGIGKKTAKDITKIFPVREELIKKIQSSTNTNALPFRDDIEKLLVEEYS